MVRYRRNQIGHQVFISLICLILWHRRWPSLAVEMAAKDKKVGVLLDGYVKADSRNLPKVDILMVISFFNESTDHIQPECEHQKLQR